MADAALGRFEHAVADDLPAVLGVEAAGGVEAARPGAALHVVFGCGFEAGECIGTGVVKRRRLRSSPDLESADLHGNIPRANI